MRPVSFREGALRYPMVSWKPVQRLHALQTTYKQRDLPGTRRIGFQQRKTHFQFKLMRPNHEELIEVTERKHFRNGLKTGENSLFSWHSSTRKRIETKTNANFIIFNNNAKHLKARGAVRTFSGSGAVVSSGIRVERKKTQKIAKVWSWNQHKAQPMVDEHVKHLH